MNPMFHYLKVGSIFTLIKDGLTCKKINRTQYRLCRNINGKWISYGLFFTEQEYTRVFPIHVQTIVRSKKQQETLVRFRALGDLARTKQNLQIIGNQHSQRLNVMQLKKLEEARMIIGWLDKQVRHEMAVAKALNKQQKQGVYK